MVKRKFSGDNATNCRTPRDEIKKYRSRLEQYFSIRGIYFAAP
jgi:hypothetical protein